SHRYDRAFAEGRGEFTGNGGDGPRSRAAGPGAPLRFELDAGSRALRYREPFLRLQADGSRDDEARRVESLRIDLQRRPTFEAPFELLFHRPTRARGFGR